MQEIDLCEATGWMQRMSLMFFFFFFLLLFWLSQVACGILLVPSPGMEPMSPALGP